MSEGETPPETPRGSPIPGCFILATILLVFGGLVLLYTFVGNYQKKEIAKFTQESAAEIPVVEPTPEETEAAMAKLSAIKTAVDGRKAERILFTAKDLNVLIATLDVTEDFGGQTHIEEITAEGIVTRMAQPVRKGIIKKGFRYLNGEFVFRPEVRKRTVAFKVVGIDPDAGTVPEKFIESYATLDFFQLDPDNEAIAGNVGSIETIYTEADRLVVETRLKPRNEAE